MGSRFFFNVLHNFYLKYIPETWKFSIHVFTCYCMLYEATKRRQLLHSASLPLFLLENFQAIIYGHSGTQPYSYGFEVINAIPCNSLEILAKKVCTSCSSSNIFPSILYSPFPLSFSGTFYRSKHAPSEGFWLTPPAQE